MIWSSGDEFSGFRLKDGITEEMMKGATLPTETVFVLETSPIKFGLERILREAMRYW